MNRTLKLVGLSLLLWITILYSDFLLKYKLQALLIYYSFEVTALPSFTFVWLFRLANGDRAGLSDY